MSSTVVFDLRADGTGRTYVYERGSERSAERAEFSLAPEAGFTLPTLPPDMEEAVLSLPVSMLDFRVVRLPVGDAARAREILPLELEGLLISDPDQIALDAVILEKIAETEADHRVLAVYAERDKVQGMINALKAAGAEPRTITSIELALLTDEYRRAGGSLEARLLEGAPALTDDQRSVRALEETLGHPTMDLRRGGLSFTRDMEQGRKLLLIGAGLLAALLLLISADLALRAWGLSREAKAMEADTLKLYTSLFPTEKPAGTQGLTYKIKAHSKEQETRDEYLRSADTLGFLLKLQAARPATVTLTQATLSRDGAILKGEASSAAAVEDFRSRLGSFLDKAGITESSASAVAGRTAFKIAASVRR